MYPVEPGDPRLDRPRPEHRHLFRLAHSINGFVPVSGHKAELLADADSMIDRLVADIDAARETVHLLFYIWLADATGLKVAEAAMRAARRGVNVRVLADDLGSRRFIRSPHWQALREAGVDAARALPIRNALLHPIIGRLDLRNHRKLMIVDNRVAYCGSQNCADPEFRIKPRFAPWVDIMVRLEGPIVGQNERLFMQDWMVHQDGSIAGFLDEKTLVSAPAPEPDDPEDPGGPLAQVIGTGPTARATAMSELFEVLIHAARRELVITTPYFVPTDAILSALSAAGYRGVRTILILPARNDSRVVSAASRSNYPELLAAGVRILEFPDGLLHAKTLTLDGEIALLGSANLDRRSFDLNYENNILFEDTPLTGAIRARQESYIAASREITLAEVDGWSPARRLWYNAVGMIGPVL